MRTNAFLPGYWQQAIAVNPPGPGIVLVLPAVLTCGSETEPPPGCEPMGKWYYPDHFWAMGEPFIWRKYSALAWQLSR